MTPYYLRQHGMVPAMNEEWKLGHTGFPKLNNWEYYSLDSVVYDYYDFDWIKIAYDVNKHLSLDRQRYDLVAAWLEENTEYFWQFQRGFDLCERTNSGVLGWDYRDFNEVWFSSSSDALKFKLVWK